MSQTTAEGYPLYITPLTTQYPPQQCDVYDERGSCRAHHYVAQFCNLNQYVFNINIKIIVIILTYINFLPIPWRLAILVDACGDLIYPDLMPGLDFYGRKTEALWFHIPRGDRARISLLLNTAWFFHMFNLAFIIYYWDYIETQTWPGAFLINVPALLSIGSVVTAGVLQGKAEAKLIAAQPERFPPAPSKYVKEAFVEWRSGRSGKPLLATIREHLGQFKEDKGAKGGPTAGFGLMEIHVNVRAKGGRFTQTSTGDHSMDGIEPGQTETV